MGKKKSCVHVCITGVYGKGNLGDEALLRVIMEAVEAYDRNAMVTVFCSDPQRVNREFNVTAVSRTIFRQFFFKLRMAYKARLFILGGGTLFYDQGGFVNDLRAIGAALFWPLVSKICGAKVMAYGQGLGPARSITMRSCIACMMTVFDAITLRDGSSIDLLEEISPCFGKAIMTCDPVVESESFQPENVSSVIDDNLKGMIFSKCPYIICSLRRPDVSPDMEKKFYLLFADMLLRFNAKTGAHICLLPAHNSSSIQGDCSILSCIESLLHDKGLSLEACTTVNWSSLEDACYVLHNAELVVANRLHPLLISGGAGVALVGILGVVYGDKIKGCMDMIGTSESFAYVDECVFDSDEVLDAMMTVWTMRGQNKHKISEGMDNWCNRAPSNRDILHSLLH